MNKIILTLVVFLFLLGTAVAGDLVLEQNTQAVKIEQQNDGNFESTYNPANPTGEVIKIRDDRDIIVTYYLRDFYDYNPGVKSSGLNTGASSDEIGTHPAAPIAPARIGK
jgi:hypothetical protein